MSITIFPISSRMDHFTCYCITSARTKPPCHDKLYARLLNFPLPIRVTTAQKRTCNTLAYMYIRYAYIFYNNTESESGNIVRNGSLIYCHIHARNNNSIENKSPVLWVDYKEIIKYRL